MNSIVNKLLLEKDKFMPEMHLRQPGFTYSACGPFTKIRERIENYKETGDSRYIYQNELDKACFQHNKAYGDFKDWQIILIEVLVFYSVLFVFLANMHELFL